MSIKQVAAQVSRTVPLQTVLIVPFVLQTLVTVGLVGYFSFKNRQEAVNDLASQLRRELTNRIEGKLQTYTEIPHNINRLNASTFAQSKIDVSAARGEFPLWQQIQIYPTVSDIYCGDRNGSTLGVRRIPADQSIELRSSNASTGYRIYGYSLDRNGQRGRLVSKGSQPFDPRVRPWYQAAAMAGEPVWSEIYADFATRLPTITASTPVYSTADRSLLGVCATDVFLPNEMSRFLANLQIGKTGSAFILERSGRLVATSTEEAIIRRGAASNQLPAVESRDPIVRATAASLRDHYRNLQQIQSVEQLDFDLDGKRQLVQVMPFKDARGLDWLIVTVLPESDFMAKIQQNIQTTVLLCTVALLLGIIICILIARWITKPITNVSRSAKALALGEWNQTLEVERSGDLGELARSFNQMAHQLQTAFAEMQSLNYTLAQNETRLKKFLESVPVGIAVLDAAGRPYYTNQKAIQLLGKGVLPLVTSEQIAEVYQLYVAGTDRPYPAEQLIIVRALNGEKSSVDNIEIHQGDQIIPIESWGTPIFDEAGNVTYAIVAFQDITERKQAERLLADYNQTLKQQVDERTNELSQEKKLLQTIIDHMPVMITLYDADGRVRLINQELEQRLGWSATELENIDLVAESFPDPEEHQIIVDHMLAATGKWMDIKTRTKDDRYIDTSWANIRLSNGMNVGIGQDISARKRAEQASILEERNRMAREIHDTLAQAFTGILLHVRTATKLMPQKAETAQAHLETVDELARTGLTEARRSVAALRPKLLEEGDLLSALEHLATQMKSSTDAHITCEVIGTAYTLSADIENHLLRIGQEALTNAIRYAHATEIHIELVYEEMQCFLRVKDDGQGFDADQVTTSQGFGLLGMSERVEHIGGELIIHSQLGRGTEVVVTVNRE
ncbi:MAG TPA: PAS domain S-box protein [Trichocoleus sp.]|jgi:PAS domain S-box-containing protein